MSFRRRIALAAAAAVAIAVVLASLLVYVLTANQLHGQVDNQLRSRARETRRLQRLFAVGALRIGPNGAASIVVSAPSAFAIAAKESESDIPGKVHEKGAGRRGRATRESDFGDVESRRPGSLFGKLPPNPDEARGYQQVVDSNGKVLARSAPSVTLPVDSRTALLAERGGEPFFRDETVRGVHMRVLAEPFGRNRAAELALPLTETDSLLGRLRLLLVLIVVGGIALAALLGRIVAGAAMLPLKRLTQTTEHVTRTQDLSGRIEQAGEDEIGRLATSFNAMLDALERSMSALDESVSSQRQLVADASHELRTPVTSVRTNIELLQQLGPQMDAEEHRRVLDDVVGQLEDLTVLINDLIDLARGEDPANDIEDVRLDTLVEEVVQKAHARAGTILEMDVEPVVVSGVPARLERAVSNLIDNAAEAMQNSLHRELRISTASLASGMVELAVADSGPGLTDEMRERLFLPYFSTKQRGTGLGLAIAAKIIQEHQGSIRAEANSPSGARFIIELAAVQTEQEPLSPEVTGHQQLTTSS